MRGEGQPHDHEIRNEGEARQHLDGQRRRFANFDLAHALNP